MKKLFIITSMFILLGGGLWLLNTDTFLPNEESKSESPILSGIDTHELSSIFIKRKNETVELVKEREGLWKVKALNYEANTQKIRKLLLKLMEVKRGDVVTKDPDQYSRFKLEDSATKRPEGTAAGDVLTLRRKEGTPLLNLVLGKKRSGGAGQYIRYIGQPAVYVIPEKIWLDSQNDSWLNKNIFDIDSKKLVKTMAFKQDKKIFSFEREKAESAWKTKKSGKTEKLNQNEITSLSELLKDLDFSKILPADTSPAKTGRQKLAFFAVTLFDGRIFKMTIGEDEVKDDNVYYCTVEMDLKKSMTDKSLEKVVYSFNKRSKPWIYALDSWQGKQFLKQRSDFYKERKND